MYLQKAIGVLVCSAFALLALVQNLAVCRADLILGFVLRRGVVYHACTVYSSAPYTIWLGCDIFRKGSLTWPRIV